MSTTAGETQKGVGESLSKQPRRGSVTAGILFSIIWFGEYVLQSGVTSVAARDVAIRSVVYLVVSLFLIARFTPLGVWSPSFIFLFIFSVFHLGLTPHWIGGTDPGFHRQSDYNWFDGPASVIGLQIVNLAVLGYTVVTLLLGEYLRGKASRKSPNLREFKNEHSNYSTVGSVLLILGISIWIYYAISAGGLGILSGSYENFLTVTAGTPIYYSYHIVSLGLCWAAMSPSSRLSRIAVGLFMLWGGVAFFMGLRGEVLFTIAAAVCILAVRRKMPRPGVVLVAGVLLLGIVNFAKELRKVGVSGGPPSLTWLNPIDGVTELGSTFRVLAHEVTWHLADGEELAHGVTYLVSVLRQWEGLFGIAIPEPDMRMYNIYIQDREGAIGGSVLGEALHNFGVIGPVLVMILCAFIFTRFGHTLNSENSAALFAVVAVPIFNHVRNSFVPVVPMIMLGGILMIIVMYLSTRRTTALRMKDSIRRTHDTPYTAISN